MSEITNSENATFPLYNVDIRLLVIGPPSSGKTTWIRKFNTPLEFKPIESTFFLVNQTKFQLIEMKHNYANCLARCLDKYVSGCIVFYDSTNRNSFDQTIEIIEQVPFYMRSRIILVASKIDQISFENRSVLYYKKFNNSGIVGTEISSVLKIGLLEPLNYFIRLMISKQEYLKLRTAYELKKNNELNKQIEPKRQKLELNENPEFNSLIDSISVHSELLDLTETQIKSLIEIQ